MFALGASVAAIAGMFVDRGDFLVAALASSFAGALTFAVAVSFGGRKRASGSAKRE